MSVMKDLVITGTNCITAVGEGVGLTADFVFSGFAGIALDETHADEKERPAKSAAIEGFGSRDHCEAVFMAQVADRCLTDLCEWNFDGQSLVDELFVFLGLPSEHRPGPSVDDWKDMWTTYLEKNLGQYARHVYPFFFPTGNASGIHGVLNARMILDKYPDAVCITGGIDSLLSLKTLSWLERDWRLVSNTKGRQKGVFPSQAAGFFVIETEKGADKRNKKPLARIVSKSVTVEHASFVSEKPCNGAGLTQAIRESLSRKKMKSTDIDSIFCDLNGEQHRIKEWGLADVRCFPDTSPQLIHPADILGDVGAAWMPVLAGIAAEGFARNAVGDNVLIFCADDHGERGVMIVRRP